MLSSSGPHLERVLALLATSTALLALVLGCSGGGTSSSRRDSPSLTDNEAFGRIVGTVRIGPICPVEQFPPDPACSPTPEMFGRVRILIWSSEGRLLRDIPLDSQGNYAVALEPGTYLVGTNDHGFGIGGQGSGESGGLDSIGAGEGGYGEPGDSGVAVADSPSAPSSPPSPEGEPPPSAGDSTVVFDPGGDSTIVFNPRGDSTISPIDPEPVVEGEGPYSQLPVRVELAAGETARVDIDIDTGIR